MLSFRSDTQAGYRLLRVSNDDVLNDLDAVLRAVLQACGIAE
jgi:very-short-patch-repair endonuclease